MSSTLARTDFPALGASGIESSIPSWARALWSSPYVTPGSTTAMRCCRLIFRMRFMPLMSTMMDPGTEGTVSPLWCGASELTGTSVVFVSFASLTSRSTWSALTALTTKAGGMGATKLSSLA